MRRAAILTALVTATSLFSAGHSGAQWCETPETCYACPSEPTLGCAVSATSGLFIDKPADSAESKLVWMFAWGNGAPVQRSFGEPTSGTSYSLCVYDGNTLKMNGDVAPSATHWSPVAAGGYRYENQSAEEGIVSIRQKSGPDAEVSVILKGRGAKLPLPEPAVEGSHYFDPGHPVTVQWRANGGACWSATFAPTKVITNDAESYAAKF